MGSCKPGNIAGVALAGDIQQHFCKSPLHRAYGNEGICHIPVDEWLKIKIDGVNLLFSLTLQ